MSFFGRKKFILYLFFVLLSIDWSYSFLQYYHQPIQGDLIPVILPEPQFSQVLESPFGWQAIQENIQYGGVNRYFVHQALYSSFRNVPLWLQNFLAPIESLYATAAIFKLLFHIALILLLTQYIRPNDRLWSSTFLGTALLLSPFFQANGYSHVIGIVDRSVVYAFSYALPIVLLLFYFLPFYKYHFQKRRTTIMRHPIQHLLWFALMICLSFSGPLVAPLVLLICPSILLAYWWNGYQTKKNWKTALQKLPRSLIAHFSVFILLNLYAFYLGSYNAENDTSLSLAERYARLPVGFYKLFTRKLALPLLILLLIVNFSIVRRKVNHYWQTKAGKIALCCLIFILSYLLLLPLGGYRIYRPYVLRYDTMIPVTLVVLFLSAQTFHLILQHLKQLPNSNQFHPRNLYLAFTAAVLFIFTIADSPKWDKNECEKAALYQIRHTDKSIKIVELKEPCPVLEWKTFGKAEESRYIVEMLKHWKVIDQDLRFRHVE
ncbi:MAG: hypothetical protein AAF599_13985 [Bacteroidota bacterium]